MIEQDQMPGFVESLNGLPSVWNTPFFETGYVTALAQGGLMLVTGEDAATFLHNQLSNDVEHLTSEVARRAAYCTAKGRMLASLLYWKTDEGIVVQLPNELLPTIQKRLSMFVLRAKVKIADMSKSQVTFAIGGAQSIAAISAWFPELPSAENTTISNGYGTLIRFHSEHQADRYQWICPKQQAEHIWKKLTETLQPTNPRDWQLAEIKAGIPCVTARTQEKFVPQMINFELIGGVNFRKGCYPGQEIVARSQYLGKLKRRMALATIQASGLTESIELFKEDNPEQPCGMIVNVASIDDNNSLALVEMSLADQEHGGVHCGTVDGPLVQLLPLPYEITDITR